MAIATSNDFWTSRMNASDPSNLSGDFNDSWTLSAGSALDGAVSSTEPVFWEITSGNGGQTWRQTHTSGAVTLVACFKFVTAPTSGEVIMAIDNGTYKVEVKSKGANDKLDLVGATTVTTHDLDLEMGDGDAVPIILRLTLDASGTARLYMREIIEDDDAAQHYLSVTGATGSTAEVLWGNVSGEIHWATVYMSNKGSFDPDEMDLSDWATNTILQTGIGIVQTLKDSKRFYLNTHVQNSAIRYGYDLSSKMISRIKPPSIHVILQRVESPEFLAMAGTNTDQRYEIMLYITTRGTDYRNAYRLGASIAGEAFDEIYTTLGLKGGVDSLISYDAVLDSKLDDDEVVCVHTMRFVFMKKISMLRRQT